MEYEQSFTHLPDTDIIIFSQIDPLSLLNIYRTNLYARNLLNSPRALKIISETHNLPYADSFSDFINNYEDKVATTYSLGEALSIAVVYDNVNLLFKILDIALRKGRYLSISLTYEDYSLLLKTAYECIKEKAYKCLLAIGPRVMRAKSVAFSKNDHRHIYKLLITCVEFSDCRAIVIILGWFAYLDEYTDKEKVVYLPMYRAVELGNTDMFKCLLRIAYGDTHNKLDFIIRAVERKNPRMIKVVLDTYDIYNNNIPHWLLEKLKALITTLDEESQEIINNLLTQIAE
jgi:hypothetical protein